MSENRIAITVVLSANRHQAFLQYCHDNHLSFLDEITHDHYITYQKISRCSLNEIRRLRSRINQYAAQKTRPLLPPADFLTTKALPPSDAQPPGQAKKKSPAFCDDFSSIRNLTPSSSVDCLHLSVRSTNALKSAQINTLQQMMSLTEQQLYHIRNLGKKSIQEILDANHVLKKAFRDGDALPLSPNLDHTPPPPAALLLTLSSSIERLPLSVRSTNSLKRANITSIRDLLELNAEALYNIRNIGATSVKEILTVIADLQKSFDDLQRKDYFASENISRLPASSFQRLQPLIETLLLEPSLEAVDFTALSENEQTFFRKLIQSVDIVGSDMAVQAYLDGEKMLPVMEALYHFHNKTERQNAVLKLYDAVPSYRRNRKLLPYIRSPLTQALYDSYTPLSPFICEESTLHALYQTFQTTSPETNTLHSMHSLLNFLALNYPRVIHESIDSALSSAKPPHAAYILRQRCAGKTLKELGDDFGITRERIRQIESKLIKKIAAKILSLPFDPITIVYAEQGEDCVLLLEEIKDYYKNVGELDIFLRIITDSDLFRSADFVLNEFDDIFVLSGAKQSVEQAKQLIAQQPNLLSVEEGETFLQNLFCQTALTPKTLRKLFHLDYKLIGSLYRRHRSRPTFSEIYEYMLLTYYPSGMWIYNDIEINRLRTFIASCFDDIILPEANRAISLRIADVSVLCDRGKYIHPKYIQVDQGVINEIFRYIRTDERIALSFHELFELFKDNLAARSNITNRFFLQGALKYYNQDDLYFARNYVTKEKDVGLTIELEDFVYKNGIVHKQEIFEAFPGFTEIMVSLKLGNSEEIVTLDNGYYMHAELLEIRDEDICIGDIIRNHTARHPLSSRKLYEILRTEHPAFLTRNGIADHGELFGIVKYLLKDDFVFSRPFIAKIGSEDVTNLSVILEHLTPYHSVLIDDMLAICEKHHLRFLGTRNVIRSLNDEFLRIDAYTLHRYQEEDFSASLLSSVLSALQEAMGDKGFVSGTALQDFSAFPPAPFAWNAFFLCAVAERYFSESITLIYIPTTDKYLINTVFVSPHHNAKDYESLLVTLLHQQHRHHPFITEEQALSWLAEEKLYLCNVPKCLTDNRLLRTDDFGNLQIGEIRTPKNDHDH